MVFRSSNKLFLCHFEKQWIYRRYVDDIFVTFNSHEQLKKFVEYMNAEHSNIKFIFEHEHKNTFSFLDVNI